MRITNTYVLVGFGMACCWLFVAISFYISKQSATDWFSRSGAVLCLAAAIANFALVKLHQNDLARILRDSEHSVHEKAEAILEPPATYTTIARFSYFTGVAGTAIWGYGDLLL